jgi:hypothetical protein
MVMATYRRFVYFAVYIASNGARQLWITNSTEYGQDQGRMKVTTTTFGVNEVNCENSSVTIGSIRTKIPNPKLPRLRSCILTSCDLSMYLLMVAVLQNNTIFVGVQRLPWSPPALAGQRHPASSQFPLSITNIALSGQERGGGMCKKCVLWPSCALCDGIALSLSPWTSRVYHRLRNIKPSGERSPRYTFFATRISITNNAKLYLILRYSTKYGWNSRLIINTVSFPFHHSSAPFLTFLYPFHTFISFSLR